MMKRALKAGLLALAVACCGKAAYAANFGNVSLTVTLDAEMSVSIVGSTTATFGSLPVSSAAVSSAGLVVRNDSAGVNVDYSLKSYHSTPWTLETNAGANQFALRAMFNSTKPALAAFSDSFDVLLATDTVSTTGAGSSGKFEGDQAGVNVAPAASRTMWFKILTPTSTTSTGSRELTVTVLANLPA